MACEVIAAQNVFALQSLPHRVDSAQRQFFETRRKNNFNLLNVIFGIGLGTLLQVHGRVRYTKICFKFPQSKIDRIGIA